MTGPGNERISVSVHGAEGRMGRLVTGLVEESDDCRLAGLFTEPGRGRPAGEFHTDVRLSAQDEIGTVHPPGGVILDFSLATALDGLLAGGETSVAPLVIGTTGYDADQLAALEAYAARRPVVLASNFSVGIPALALVLRLLARSLPAGPDGFGAEQIETHHDQKLDKPSGTAKWLASAWEEVRASDATPTHSVRLGGIFGEHKWVFADGEETLEVTHRAHSRRAFTRGILPAIRFAAAAGPGLYDLPAVLAGR